MWLLSILSGVLLAFPVALTVGVYLGIESQHIFHGGFPNTGGYGPNAPQTTTYCQKSYGITPDPGRYVLNPNQWGLSASEASSMCMNVTSKPNADSKSKAAATFAATWQYPMGPVDQPVHAFPNAKLNTTDIPIRLSNLSALNFDVAWNYGAGNDKPTSTNTSGLVDAEMNANVCIDMFLAADKAVSDDTTKSDYEVMVWFGAFGAATQPIGLPAGAVDHHTVNGTTFDLYAGANAFGQKVFTWVADQNTTRFVGEISGLVNKLQANGGPQTTAWLGYIAFGSEAYSAAKNVTFSVTELAVDIQAVSA